MRVVCKRAILPEGFLASGIHSGIKRKGKLDLALFYSQMPAKASCKFTTNSIVAAPIVVSKKYLKANKLFQALIANSGNANCFTGQAGLKDAQDSTKIVACVLGIKKESILVSSTGIIARKMPMAEIKRAVPGLVKILSKRGIDQAKEAILTTDTFAKEVTARFKIGNKTITICGVAKGAGMIAPNMATMLAFVFSDANITQKALDKALGISLDSSFNCITVDGCMSTNDSLIMMANGACGNALIDVNKNFKPFIDALKIVCLELAKMVVKDAEGISKFIQIKVSRAKSFKEARTVALSIANSNLFKTAVYGENPNFGRIAAAAGASGIGVLEKDLKIKVSSLKKKEIYVDVSVGRGDSSAIVYTSDLTPEYIKINADYN